MPIQHLSALMETHMDSCVAVDNAQDLQDLQVSNAQETHAAGVVTCKERINAAILDIATNAVFQRSGAELDQKLISRCFEIG